MNITEQIEIIYQQYNDFKDTSLSYLYDKINIILTSEDEKMIFIKKEIFKNKYFMFCINSFINSENFLFHLEYFEEINFNILICSINSLNKCNLKMYNKITKLLSKHIDKSYFINLYNINNITVTNINKYELVFLTFIIKLNKDIGILKRVDLQKSSLIKNCYYDEKIYKDYFLKELLIYGKSTKFVLENYSLNLKNLKNEEYIEEVVRNLEDQGNQSALEKCKEINFEFKKCIERICVGKKLEDIKI